MGNYHEEQYELLECEEDFYYRLRIHVYSHVQISIETNEQEAVYVPTDEIITVKLWEYFSFEDQGYLL